MALNDRWSAQGRAGRHRFRIYALIWLLYLVYPLIGLLSQRVSALQLVVGLVAMLGTAAIYIYVFQEKAPPDGILLLCGLLVDALGVGSAMLLGASYIGLFIYAATIFARLRSMPAYIAASAATIGAMLLLGLHLGMAPGEIGSLVLTGVLAAVGLRGMLRFIDYAIALRDARQKIEQLAKAEERARIARDVHDLLGHTLSVIVLKSDLAQQLLQTPGGQEEAAKEIGEVRDVARTALREVREAVTGYRRASLSAELVHAETTLVTAGITCKMQSAPVDLPAEGESALALVLREAVTNVVRHSHARTCTIEVHAQDGQAMLRVEDDGTGSEIVPGNGLQGMRERLRPLGGSLEWECGHGMVLHATLPAIR